MARTLAPPIRLDIGRERRRSRDQFRIRCIHADRKIKNLGSGGVVWAAGVFVTIGVGGKGSAAAPREWRGRATSVGIGVLLSGNGAAAAARSRC